MITKIRNYLSKLNQIRIENSEVKKILYESINLNYLNQLLPILVKKTITEESRFGTKISYQGQRMGKYTMRLSELARSGHHKILKNFEHTFQITSHLFGHCSSAISTFEESLKGRGGGTSKGCYG